MKKFKERISNNIKENKYVCLTFVISIFIFLLVFSLKSITPIGNNTLLTVDFYHQYGPLLSELYDKVTNFEDLTYSFNSGLGLPFFRNFYNYLSSPFNIIMFLFGRDNIVTSFSFIIAFKIIIAACIMTYFLRKFFKKDSIFTTIFGLSYGFSSYFVAFYWNIMWLDSLIFLPLVILGLKNLIDNNKINLYILSLFLSIISNYFISYMICIFSCIFFLVYIIFKENITRKELLQKIGLFAISSLLAGGIAAFMLLPYVSSLSTISATGDKFVFYKTFNFNFFNFLANHLSLVDSIVFSSQDYFLPNISSGILTFILVLAFYLNSNIKIKHKIMASVFLIILIFSFIYVPLDFIWHGFHTPNDLPFRYSFIYVFIINIISYYSILNIKNLKIQYSVIISIVLAILIFYLYKINFITNFAFEINILIMLISLVCFVIYKLNNNNIVKYILILVVIADIVLNINTNWDINHDKNIFMDNYSEISSVIKYIKNHDDSFYRIEKGFNQTLNDGAWYNYNGMSIFSSVAYEKMARTQKRLGIAGNYINSYYYKQNTPIYNSIMSIKYLVDLESKNPLYEQYNTINYHEIYKNNYALSPVFAVSKNIKKWDANHLNPFTNQENFVNLSTNVENIFIKLPITYDKNQDIYKFSNDSLFNLSTTENPTAILNLTPEENGNVYIYVESYSLNNFLINNKFYSITTNEPYILDIGYYEKNSNIEIKIPLNNETSTVNFMAYQMNVDKFKEFYKICNKNELQITDFNNSYIEGIIEVNEDKTVFTSIPYDEGFKVYIDNKKIKTFKIDDSFLAFDINEGTHNIKIKYKIPHFKTGIIISVLSILILGLINVLSKRKFKLLNTKK